MKQENDVRDKLLKSAEKAHMEKEAHTLMLEILAELAPEDRRPIFTLPVKVSRVTSKIGDLMMLETQVEDGVGYATKACEFLDRVEEACEAFMEQERVWGNNMAVIDRVKAQIVGYDEKTGEAIIRAPANFIKMAHQQQREVWCEFIDSRPLSDRQRRSCYAMIREISDWSGDTPEATKEVLKLDFWCGELLEIADTLFSLSNAPMSVVAAFQSWLARFIVRNDVPCKKPMLEYIDDVQDYLYACLINKKCPICGKKADLHHYESVGAGRNRDKIIHEGMEVLPLCREHHTEVHTIGRDSFMAKYHLGEHGIVADKTICKIYKLKSAKAHKEV